MPVETDVIVVGAGAAGLMCAREAGLRGRRVIVLERQKEVGRKILISGGGRCNFTNLYSEPKNFISKNPHFCKSALARFSPADFIALVEKHGIAYHEKKAGQLFCDRSARQITQMLTSECTDAGVTITTGVVDITIVKNEEQFSVRTPQNTYRAGSLVIATGGLSIPKIGATDFGYQIAAQFGLNVTALFPGLVPLTWNEEDLVYWKDLSGVSADVTASSGEMSFRENMLFTHRGLSGPAILQISSYWKDQEPLRVNMIPDGLPEWDEIRRERAAWPTILGRFVPSRFAVKWCERFLPDKTPGQMSRAEWQTFSRKLSDWAIHPSGTEGYLKAEVTLGGIDTDELSSKTMESNKVKGLYFIGEVVDVTGHLGGHNFQWAWASGVAAGRHA